MPRGNFQVRWQVAGSNKRGMEKKAFKARSQLPCRMGEWGNLSIHFSDSRPLGTKWCETQGVVT